MRLSALPFPALLSGFIAVLVGYASSAAIIWQAAAAAHVSPREIAGWLTLLGIAMGVSTLALTLWYRAPILTAWSTPGAALLVTSLPGSNIHQAVGVFIVSSLLIFICGASGLFARLMRILPASLASAMLAGILLQFGLNLFSSLQGHFYLSATMLVSWLAMKCFAPRYAVVAAMLAGLTVCLLNGTFKPDGIPLDLVLPSLTQPEFSWANTIGIGIPLFLVTMASQNAPGIATLYAAGYNHIPVSPLIVVTALTALLLAPFGVFSVCIAAITAAICQSPEAHPQKEKRWLAAAAAGLFYLLAGFWGGSISGLLAALPLAFIQILAGLALLSTLAGSLFQALRLDTERDAAIVTFLITASGVSLLGIGSAFWGLMAGGISYGLLSLRRGPQL